MCVHASVRLQRAIHRQRVQQQHPSQKALHCTQQHPLKAKHRGPPKIRLQRQLAVVTEQPALGILNSQIAAKEFRHKPLVNSPAIPAQLPACLTVDNQLSSPLLYASQTPIHRPDDHQPPLQAGSKACNPVDNAAGCIRAEPHSTWRNRPQAAPANIHTVTDPGLGKVQGRQNSSSFQIAFELSKAGQLRAPNLHAAVKASKQLMHRFVVCRSAVAHMGVFTTGKRSTAKPCLLLLLLQS